MSDREKSVLGKRADDTPEEILRTMGLGHTYGNVVAVKGVDLVIHQGETLGLVGESGCGKTTVERMIVKLLPISSGTVLFRGADIDKLKGKRELAAFRRDVQMIFQDPYASLDPHMRVRDIVAEGIDNYHIVPNGRAREARVEQLLDMVGLRKDAAERYAYEFSGGQRQRIGIARALAVEPSLIICDEPISALDVSVQAQVVNLLQDLQREQGLKYLFIAHDLSVVRYISDRIAVMRHGRIVETGSSEAVYHHPIHPYTQRLIAAVPKAEPYSERHRRLQPFSEVDDSDEGQVLHEFAAGHWAAWNGDRTHVTDSTAY